MTTNLAFDFTVNKDARTITVTREFAAALPVVWDAYTKSEMLDQWWAPKPWKARTTSMDFREGGRWHYAMVGPDGQEHYAIQGYTKIQHQKMFTGLNAFADAEGNVNTDLPQSTWEITFTGKGRITLVEIQITYANIAQLETILQMGFREGLTMAMEGLDEVLAEL